MGNTLDLFKISIIIIDALISRFGHLSEEIFRACRLVVDTGMHALGWTQVKYWFLSSRKRERDGNLCRKRQCSTC